ncbi:hypothetical protein CHH47_14280 [Priestia megaterium]|nr:hypothetical protein CHH47_14280 [Priestia megaterium]
MNFRMEKYKVILLLFSLLPMFYQFFSLENYFINVLRYTPLFLIIVTVGIFRPFSLKVNKESLLLIIPVTLNYLVVPLISFNIGNYDVKLELFNIFLYLISLVAIVMVVSYVENVNTFLKLVKYTLVTNSLVLTVVIIINFKQLLDARNYMWLVSERAERASYGFIHPNTAGVFLFTELVLLLLCLIIYKKKRLIIPVIFYFICLLATGSRTALICIVIMLGIYYVVKFLNKINNKLQVVVASSIFILIFVFLIDYNWGGFWANTSKRDYYYMHNIKYLLDSGYILFGIGPVNNTSMSLANPNILITDNWYLGNTILYGVIGTLIFISFLGAIFAKFINIINSNDRSKKKLITLWGVSLLVSFCVYSFFETILYVPGISLSIIFWTLILSIIKINRAKFIKRRVL